MSFALLETMRAEAGAVRLIDRHCERLRRSASLLEFSCDVPAIRMDIEKAAQAAASPSRLRLLLERNGGWKLEGGPLPTGAPQRLLVSPHRVNSSDPLLYHKTTDRRIYESARHGLDQDTDVILVNERGEATETAIANIAVLRNGVWITPPISGGLLGGVMRAELLDNGVVVERIVRVETLIAGETIRCFNALRGLFEAQLQLWR